jgi:hypothetical protein
MLIMWNVANAHCMGESEIASMDMGIHYLTVSQCFSGRSCGVDNERWLYCCGRFLSECETNVLFELWIMSSRQRDERNGDSDDTSSR